MHAVLIRSLGTSEIDLVMDAVQDAFEAALVQWRFAGIPDDPPAWLMRVARNKAIGALRKKAVRAGAAINADNDEFLEGFDPPEEHVVQDAQLRLLFTCIQPSFPIKKQVAFTLKVLCGFGTAEIARALLMEPEAAKKMIQRARQDLQKEFAHRQLPSPTLPDTDLNAVHAVLYLMFNEGFKTTRGSAELNTDLCYESIRLTKLLLREDLPALHETNALLALMFFGLARSPARFTDEGIPVPLEDQARGMWDPVFIREGQHYLNAARDGSPGRYYLEALIASVHCAANDHASTDWHTLEYLYDLLEQEAPSSAVRLNRIVAISHAQSPRIAIEKLNTAVDEGIIENDHLHHATMADLSRRCGDHAAAMTFYEQAMQRSPSQLDRRFFQQRIEQCLSLVNS